MQNNISDKRLNLSELILKLNIDCITYWNISRVLSYNAFMNISMGGRGIGKTTQAILWCLKNLINTGEEFIYLRRYKTETAQQKELLDKIVDDVSFKGDKLNGGEWWWKGNRLGYLKALSVASSYKSVNFDKVTTIIYDEAIIKKGSGIRYLKDEIVALFEFMSTVFRNRKNVRVFILGNNLNYFNPYCEYFDIKVFNDKYYDKDRNLYFEYCKNSPVLVEIEKDTPLYSLTKGTTYHEYHYDNKVLTNTMVETTKIMANDKEYFGLVFNDKIIVFYRRFIGDDLYLVVNISKTKKEEYITLVENDKINYWYYKLFKDMSYYTILYYRYYDKHMLYTSEDAGIIIDMLMEVI